MAANQTGLRELARQLAQLDRRVRSIGSSGQLAHSSIEDGAVQAYDRDGSQTMLIGKQWDGTYTSTVVTGPVPPTPTAPIVTDGTEGISVRWDGAFEGGAVAPMDFLRVDIHISAVDGFTPDFSNRYGTIIPPTGGEVAFHFVPGTWYVKLVCWSQAGVPSAASVQSDGTANAIPANPTDGDAPASSPAPDVFSGIEEMYVRWTPVVNADPVTYDVHVSTTLSFTPGPTTKVGETRASMFTIRALPGDPPPEGETDPRALQYDVPYYVAIVARDEDGSAAPSTQAVGFIIQATGANLAVGSIAAQHILAGTLTGDLFSATVILAGVFKTAETGQRVEMGPDGIQGYRSDNSLMFSLPTDSSSNIFLDGDVVARSLTATGVVTLRSNNNSVEKDAVVKLRNGIASPVATPVMAIGWGSQTTQCSTASLSAAQKTGALGTFDFVGSEVSCIEWKPSGSYWVVHQIRPTGTRAWFFDYFGAPHQVGSEWFHDYTDWEIWSVIELTTSTSAKNGVYRMARWIPSGTANTYYLWCPQGGGLNRYSRQNGLTPPVVGTNGTDVYVAEVISNQLNIRYFLPNGDGNNLPAPFTVYQSSTGYTNARPLSTCFYDAAGFDIGAPRYLVAERGFNSNNRLLYTSGTNANSIFPGGSGNSWVSATKEAESFEAALNNPRCIAYDGSNFWTMGGDGVMYQHTETHWDPSVRSSTIWAQYTFYDSVGTTHETTPGPAKSFFQKRRTAVQFFVPPIPGAGGADEPNQVSLYVGLGATQPSNANMWWQADSASTIWLEDFETSGASNPPTTNSFPNTNPGKIQSDDGNLVISGDGSIKIGGKDVALGTATRQYFSSSGTWSKPAGAKLVRVQVQGGGGAGGGAGSAAAGTASAGAGGGGGGYAEKWYLASDLASSIAVTVGGGGVGVSATTGGGGGASNFQHTTNLIGNGGNGGGSRGVAATPFGSAPGAGGSGSGGDISFTGSGGGPGWGNAGFAIGGAGGGSHLGGGAAGRGNTSAASQAGLTGGQYGGGGGGAICAGTSGAQAGGNGASGVVIVTVWY